MRKKLKHLKMSKDAMNHPINKGAEDRTVIISRRFGRISPRLGGLSFRSPERITRDACRDGRTTDDAVHPDTALPTNFSDVSGRLSHAGFAALASLRAMLRVGVTPSPNSQLRLTIGTLA